MITRRSLVAAAPALILLGCDRDKPAPPPNPTQGRIGTSTPPIGNGWFTQHSYDWVRLVQQGEGFDFDFPADPGSAHYIVKSSGPISGVVRMTFRLSGGGVLEPLQTTGGGVQTRTAVRPYFQRRGDNLSGQGEFQSYRWWAAPAFLDPRVEGEATLTVPLLVEYWSDVFAGKDPMGFAAAMANCGVVGFTCGSESFAGHGIRAASGRVTFHLVRYSVGM